MQKIATRIFIYASVAFGVIGLILVSNSGFGPNSSDASQPNATLIKLLFAAVFIILPSFALSVAGKYLKDKS